VTYYTPPSETRYWWKYRRHRKMRKKT